MLVLIKPEIEFGEVLYLKCDAEGIAYCLTEIIVTPNLTIKYRLSDGMQTIEVYDFETTKNVPEKNDEDLEI